MTGALQTRIYLADERGLEEAESSRSYRTFNFGSFFNEYKSAYGDLYALNDESLAGGQAMKMTVPVDSYVILLPVVGGIRFKDSLRNQSLLAAGEMQLVYLPALTDFEVSNPYEEELVNYLQFRIKGTLVREIPVAMITVFDLVLHKKQLITLVNTGLQSSCFLRCSIGQFSGREEASYILTPGCQLFAFVIEGAFELEGRLLHPRDGLAIWNSTKVLELEALSNEAIIFLLEFGR